MRTFLIFYNLKEKHLKISKMSLILLERTLKNGDVLVLTPSGEDNGQAEERSSEVESRKTVSCYVSNTSRFFERSRLHLSAKQLWGCTGFDAVIGKSGLRVRALFSVINEHLKRNDNKVVSLADRRAAKVAALAA